MLTKAETGGWLTVTPLLYGRGGTAFWGRDSGLICLGLRSLGVNCRFVALGPERESQTEPLILTDLSKMREPDWWRQWKAGVVLLNSWAAPRYEPVARAIREAGCRLMVRLDTDGVVSPKTGFMPYLIRTFWLLKEHDKPIPWLLALAKAGVFKLRPSVYDLRALQHLRHADYILIESPIALQRYRRFLHAYDEDAIAAKLRVVAHPVAEHFRHDRSVPKGREILVVGRWKSFFKDASRLVPAIAEVLKRERQYRATIVGNNPEVIKRLLARYGDDISSRIRLHDRMPHQQLIAEYQRARLLLVSSRAESFHIASAEALCCGCSVAGPPQLPSMVWFCSASSGTVAITRRAEDLADAACAEIAAWENGLRDPEKISAYWSTVCRSVSVARQLLSLFQPTGTTATGSLDVS